MENQRALIVGRLYKHFKGTMYKVVDVAEHTETGETMVIYHRADDANKLWARPLDMSLSEVDHDKYPDVAQKMRFELVTPE